MKYTTVIKLIFISLSIVLTLSYIIWSVYLYEFVHRNCTTAYQSLPNCLDIIRLGDKYQYFFFPVLALLLSLIPLFFAKEHAYWRWVRFVLPALPIMLILIFLTPVHAPGDFISLGFNREIAALTFSTLFLIISWGVTLHAVLLGR